jgi:hypothetical protein
MFASRAVVVSTAQPHVRAHLPSRIDPRVWPLLRDGLTIVGLIVGLFYVWMLQPGAPFDAHAYYAADLADPYHGARLNGFDAYLYSPAFAQMLEPLRAVPFETFILVWRLAALVVLVWLAGPLTLPVLLLGPVASELNAGNINLFVAAAVVAGFRFPAVWGFILLTKVTPGVGLLWFAVRREWRALGIAAAATAAVVLVSFAVAPGLWRDWIALLTSEGQAGHRPDFEVVALALPLRLVIAAMVVTWGARNDYRWSVPVAVFLAMPASWWITLSVLVALVALQAGSRRFRQLATLGLCVGPREHASRRKPSPLVCEQALSTDWRNPFTETRPNG